jgi:hypothetical protein
MGDDGNPISHVNFPNSTNYLTLLSTLPRDNHL